jgi:NifB/MoaA-like Fe-S oxidoreductase
VVPLGVSAHSREPELRPHTSDEAAAVVDAVERWQLRYLDALGRRLVYAADELYLLAGRPFPPLDEYDDLPQHENGIGMAATFVAEVEAALRGNPGAGRGTRPGFFASIDGAPASGYRAPRAVVDESHDDSSAPVTILTGAYGEQVIAPLVPRLADAAGAPVRTLRVDNHFFGGNIGVTGLLTGADLARVLVDEPGGDRYLLPDVALSEGRFLDDVVVAELPRPVEVIKSDGASLVTALR